MASGKKNKNCLALKYRLRLKELERENRKLQKENEIYRTNWICKMVFSIALTFRVFLGRPTGAAATYFIDVGKVLSGTPSIENNLTDTKATIWFLLPTHFI